MKREINPKKGKETMALFILVMLFVTFGHCIGPNDVIGYWECVNPDNKIELKFETFYSADAKWEFRSEQPSLADSSLIYEHSIGTWKIENDSLFHKSDKARIFRSKNSDTCCTRSGIYDGDSVEVFSENGIRCLRFVINEWEGKDTAICTYSSSTPRFQLPDLMASSSIKNRVSRANRNQRGKKPDVFDGYKYRFKINGILIKKIFTSIQNIDFEVRHD